MLLLLLFNMKVKPVEVILELQKCFKSAPWTIFIKLNQLRMIYGMTFVSNKKMKTVQLRLKGLNCSFQFYFQHLLTVSPPLFLTSVVSFSLFYL